MKVQVLHIDECTNWEETRARMRQALDGIGFADVPVDCVLIRTERDAVRSGFAGSPTIAVDGEDLFPSDGRSTDLACRVYLTETGLAGAPTRTQLERALRERV
ncbi:hypothetical protein [Agromyces sp. H66]|uniref:hypothetical protein n=1 Tax=Agromyces sp. H66 TaxID=2529859 RepID=UPI0010A9A6CA|nr:hypothetical protein [Agromyces sp. H66]